MATAATLSLTGGTANHVGHFTATCGGAVDNMGNHAAPVSVQYDVHYTFGGFGPPLSPDPANGGTCHAGRTIPLKWTLQNAQGGNIVTLSSILAVQLAPDPSCTLGGEGPISDADAPGASGLTVDGDGFHFNWQTKGLPVGCYAVLVKSDDGSRVGTVVQLR